MEEGKPDSPVSAARCLMRWPLTGWVFADPIYGGNKNKVAWKMIGFPGLPASYREEIKTYYNKKYDKEPQSIADFS